MIANYHSHTPLCHHAVGEPRQYVETAIKRGLKILGFSDHVPQPGASGMALGRMRMLPEQTDGYVKEVLSLKKEYEKDIEILLGFETEYFRYNFQKLCRHLSQYPVDYMILGQHFVPNEEHGVYIGDRRQAPGFEDAYAELCCEAMETGLFSVLAHPDVINIAPEKDVALLPVFKTAARLDIPVELNLLGLAEDRCYPRKNVFESVKEAGCKVILGCDAHCPEAVAEPTVLLKAKEFLSELEITPESTLKLIKPDFTRWI